MFRSNEVAIGNPISLATPRGGVARRGILHTRLGGHDGTKGGEDGDYNVDNATESFTSLWFHFYKGLIV